MWILKKDIEVDRKIPVRGKCTALLHYAYPSFYKELNNRCSRWLSITSIVSYNDYILFILSTYFEVRYLHEQKLNIYTDIKLERLIESEISKTLIKSINGINI